jgi:hypothetical protein
MNTRSITWAERIVYQKTAFEVLVGNDEDFANAPKEATALRQLFETTVEQPGERLGIDALLWDENEPTYVHQHRTRNGAENVTALEHWYLYLAKIRNGIIHKGVAEQVEYRHEQSPYNGWLLWIADRVLREAIAVQLGNCGFPAAWRQGMQRAGFRALERLGGNADIR